ncbi:helix-turn-helix transcriptional regulator [Hymenobacter nivis]|uniref:helix-turn-helix transcriptional regulator n=1 Tax=Hymenobacter nivis TaxID=1850093 RepID=UPI0013A53346|nr:helix-turn-helix transcriptional regulator [Hymenobacter nivis]
MLAPVNLRFAELIQEIGLTKNAFAQSLGKTASVIQHLIDGRNKPGYDLLCKVFEIYPNVSKDWLMEGHGPMLLTGPPSAASAAAPVPQTSAVALKKTAGVPSLFAAQVADEALEAPAASAPQPAASPAVPLVVPPVTEAVPPVVAPPVGAPALVPAATAAPVPAADVAIGAALQTQHLLHQLALAEMRNQYLVEQQQLLRQMLDMAQGR